MSETRANRRQPECDHCGRKLMRRGPGVWVHDDTRSMYCAGVTSTDNLSKATPKDEIR